eukprot:8300055-Alexandrium_andersonii.AAC.1
MGGPTRLRMQCVLQHAVDHQVNGAMQAATDAQLHDSGVVLTTSWGPEPVSDSLARGPISLLLASFCRAGIRMGVDWCVWCAGLPSVSLVQAPWPAVQRLLRAAYLRAAFLRVASGRESVVQAPAPDWDLTLDCMASLSSKHCNFMRAVVSGAIWTDHERGKACQSDGSCSKCGASRGDLWHLLWDCPHHHRDREEVLRILGSTTPSQLPRALALHGIAPQLSAGADGPLWPGEDEGQYRAPLELAECGLQFDRLSTASMVAHVVNGPFPEVSPIEVQWCDKDAPARPNTYSDGSIANPGIPSLSYGGAGVTLP